VNDAVFNLLCPFQLAWINERSPLALWEKSRRIGATWVQALAVVLDLAGREASNKLSYWHSSADMTASSEFIGYCGEWAGVINAVAKCTGEPEVIDEADAISAFVMRFANGSKIVAGSSNPKFFRSKGGSVGLDEFDFHRDQRELFKAAHATAMFWGYPLRAWSTVNGEGTVMDQMCRQVQAGTMKGAYHKTTIEDAVADGIVERIIMKRKKLSYVPEPDDGARKAWLEELRGTCPDQQTWDQEYMCIRRADNSSLLTYDLIQGCEESNLTLTDDVQKLPADRSLYAGYDVARKKDLSVLWVLERVGDVYWTRLVRTMQGVNFAAQEGLLNVLLANPGVKRLCLDSSGMGMDLAERLKNKWSYRFEGVNFTAPVKAELALPLLRCFQDRLVRIPAAGEVREDLHKIRKVVTAANNIRFEAEHDESGHADRFWALALAYHAADTKAAPVRAPLTYKPAGW